MFEDKFEKMRVNDYANKSYDELPEFVKLEGNVVNLNYNSNERIIRVGFADETGAFAFSEKVDDHVFDYLNKCLTKKANTRLLFKKEDGKFTVVAFINVNEVEKHRAALKKKNK